MANKRKPASVPNMICPFSGQAIEVVPLNSGKYQVRGPGWVCVKLFDFKSEGVHWASHRDGVAPAFEARPKIEVTVNNEPEGDPLVGLMPDSLRKAQ